MKIIKIVSKTNANGNIKEIKNKKNLRPKFTSHGPEAH